jgi:hypothetical protein
MTGLSANMLSLLLRRDGFLPALLLTRGSSTLRKQTMPILVPVSECFFLFWICFKLAIIHLNYAVAHIFLIIFSKCIFAPLAVLEKRVKLVLIFHNSFFISYRHFGLGM